MLDLEAILEEKIERSKKDIDNPASINGFNGTWAISDHKRIAESLRMFLMLSFGTARLERVELDEINDLLNEVWDGPGSLEKIWRMERELSKTVNFTQTDMPRQKPSMIQDDKPVADTASSASDFNVGATLD